MTASRNLPVHESIKQHLRRRIERGELGAGDQLPSEHELARQFEVSRSLARQALRELEIEGYITRSQGSRSRVAPRREADAAPGSSKVLALSFMGVRSAFTNAIGDAFARRAYELGYHVLTHNLWLDSRQQCDFFRMLRGCGIAGLGVGLWQDVESDRLREVMEDFADARFPVVQIDRHIPGFAGGDVVASDNVAIGERLTEALLARGHRSICIVVDSPSISAVHDRFEGWRRALLAHGLPADEGLVVELDASKPSKNASLRKVLSGGRRPDAFFCINEYLLSRVNDYLLHKGHDAGKEFGLAVVDDSRLADRLALPAATAVQDAEQIGAASAECLVSRIANPDRPPRQHLVTATFSDEAAVRLKGGRWTGDA